MSNRYVFSGTINAQAIETVNLNTSGVTTIVGTLNLTNAIIISGGSGVVTCPGNLLVDYIPKNLSATSIGNSSLIINDTTGQLTSVNVNGLTIANTLSNLNINSPNNIVINGGNITASTFGTQTLLGTTSVILNTAGFIQLNNAANTSSVIITGNSGGSIQLNNGLDQIWNLGCAKVGASTGLLVFSPGSTAVNGNGFSMSPNGILRTIDNIILNSLANPVINNGNKLIALGSPYNVEPVNPLDALPVNTRPFLQSLVFNFSTGLVISSIGCFTVTVLAATPTSADIKISGGKYSTGTYLFVSAVNPSETNKYAHGYIYASTATELSFKIFTSAAGEFATAMIMGVY